MEQNPYESPRVRSSRDSPHRRRPRLRHYDALIVAIAINVVVAAVAVYLVFQHPDYILAGVFQVLLNIACIAFLFWLRRRLKRKTEPPELPLNRP